jgi:hypothetical protein
MNKIDELVNTQTYIDGKWVIARPILDTFRRRLKDAFQVLIGKADAVKFYKQ